MAILSNVQANFENNHINDLIRFDNGVANINYGYNAGGYESNVFFITADAGALSINTVMANIQTINFNDENDSQFYIVNHQVNYEDDSLYDDYTGEQIIPAYGDE